MDQPERIDFKQLISELGQHGVSLYKIALMTHRHYKQVQRWSRGSEPRYYEGQMLLLIHSEYVPRATLTNVTISTIQT